MAHRSKVTVDTTGIEIFGSGYFKDDKTIAQDGARVADLASYTVLARQISDGYLVPLTDVDPAITPATLTCGAIGGTLAEFAALASASFKIGIDGETPFEVVCDFSGIDSVADTAGYMTCGALGGTIPEFQAVSDGQFGIAIDGNAAIQVGGLDFSGLDSEQDTPGYYTCGANGANIGAWNAVTDGAFEVVVNGLEIALSGLDFSTAATLNDIADTINYAAAGRLTVIYDGKTDIYRIVSNTTGEKSTVAAPTAPVAGTDISAAGFLNGAAAGAATAGTGGEGTAQTITDIINAAAAGRFFCYQSGDEIVFVSPTRGEVSAVSVLTAGTAGTDISGAGFLNGLTGTGTPTAGTGGENLGESIVDIINAELAGRAECSFDGDKFVFWSPTQGYGSAVSYLTAGATGTDISGASYLNGLTGTGVLGAATTGDGTNVPWGIFWGEDIAAADLVAGDVDNQRVLRGGSDGIFVLDQDKVVLENSLDLDDYIPTVQKTIREYLEENLNIATRDTTVIGQVAPI
ncbi:MAG: DUF3383 family protein [Reinekea sp.]